MMKIKENVPEFFVYSRGAGRGSTTDMFWAMPLAAPQADGKRISFNANRSGGADQYVHFLDGPPIPP